MSTDAAETATEQRWAEANAILNGSQDQAVQQRTRRRRTRTWLLLAGVFVILTSVGGLAGFWVAGRQHTDPATTSSSDPLWIEVVGLTCTVLGLLVMILGFVQMRRSGQFGGRWRAPTSVLTWSQRRDLRRQVLGRAPLQNSRLALLRDLATRMTKLNWLILLFTGVVIMQVGGAISSPGPWRVGFVVALGLMYLAAGIQIHRDARRANRFLVSHPEHL